MLHCLVVLAVVGALYSLRHCACADQTRAYFTQLRQELGLRLVEVAYMDGDHEVSKWWGCWTKRKFLGQ
jgi:hypothetical protein